MKKVRAQLDADYSNAKRTGSLPFPNALPKPVKVS